MKQTFLFTTSNELIRVPADALVYIKADGNYSEIAMADGTSYTITKQLGQIESRLSAMVGVSDYRFMRIGKSLIINLEYITFINPTKQKLILSDGVRFRHEVTASKEALKALKEFIEEETEHGNKF